MKVRIIIILFSILGFSSCAIAPTSSKFPMDKITLGANKSIVRKECGIPFRSDMFTRDHKKIEVLYYKEPARVQNTGFIITTALTFENDSLTSIIQNDNFVSGIELSVDSVRRR